MGDPAKTSYISHNSYIPYNWESHAQFLETFYKPCGTHLIPLTSLKMVKALIYCDRPFITPEGPPKFLLQFIQFTRASKL